MISGNIYGIVLNDRNELEQLGPSLSGKPYLAPPSAAVVYQKPSSSIARGPISVPPEGLVAAATVSLLFSRDAVRLGSADVASCIGACALAVDMFTANSSYYRPAIANRNADGRLILGDFVRPGLPAAITLSSDGVLIHEWQLSRLARDANQLVADLSQYLGFKAGDVLLIGLPGDAPLVHAGQELRIEGTPLPAITAHTVQGESA
jgi:5-oxopent-3-ene-1,2,5-tricarboxylate decarboxylase/2-hydroxyhepta-2,4-diene-1,7-dioate isomerase